MDSSPQSINSRYHGPSVRRNDELSADRAFSAAQILDLLFRCQRRDIHRAMEIDAQIWPESGDWMLNLPQFRSWQKLQFSGAALIEGPPQSDISVLLRSIFLRAKCGAWVDQNDTVLFYRVEKAAQRKLPKIAIPRSFLWQLFFNKTELVPHALPLFREFGYSVFHSHALLWEILFDALSDEATGRVFFILDGLDDCEADVRIDVLSRLLGHCVKYMKSSKHCCKLIVAASQNCALTNSVSRLPGSVIISLLGAEEQVYRRAAFKLSLPSLFKNCAIRFGANLEFSRKDRLRLEKHILASMGDDWVWPQLLLRSAYLNLKSSSVKGSEPEQLRNTVLSLPTRTEELVFHLMGNLRFDDENFGAPILWNIVTLELLGRLNLSISLSCPLEGGGMAEERVSRAKGRVSRAKWRASRAKMILSGLLREPVIEFGERAIWHLLSFERTELENGLYSLNRISVARICLLYILSDKFNDAKPWLTTAELSEIDHFLSKDRFYEYAALNWYVDLDSVSDIPEDVWVLVESVCRQESAASRLWLQVYSSFLPITARLPYQLLPLHIASILGINALVQRLTRVANLQQDRSILSTLISAIDPQGRTALYWAAEFGHSAIVQSLLELGADTTPLDNLGYSALEAACWEGNEACIQLLLDAWESSGTKSSLISGSPLVVMRFTKARLLIRYCDKMGRRSPLALMMPFIKDKDGANTTGLELLLRPGSDWLTMRTNGGMNALHLAVQVGNSSVIKQLVGIGVDVDCQSIEAKTPIHAAVEKRDMTSLVTLLSASRKVDLQDNNGKTGLHRAVGWPEGVNCFLQWKANTDAQDQDGNTPLHLAAEIGCCTCLQVLLMSGANPHIHNLRNDTPADIALRSNHMNMLEALADIKALPTKPGRNGQTLLHYACEKGYDRLITIILSQGVGLDSRDQNMRTPLELLAWNQNYPMINQMIKGVCDWESALLKAAAGGQCHIVTSILGCVQADISHVLHEAWSAAVREDRLPVCKILLTAGLDVNREGVSGRSPFWHAVACGAKKVVTHLIKTLHPPKCRSPSVGRIPSQDRLKGVVDLSLYCNGMTALHKALSNSDTEIVQILLEAGANVHQKDQWNASAIHIAVQANSLKAVRLLLLHAADVEQRLNGKTPLDIAVSCSYASIVQLLLEKGAKIHNAYEKLNASDALTVQVLLRFMDPKCAQKTFCTALDRIDLPILERLINMVDLNERVWSEPTPLIWAAKRNVPSVVQLLLKGGPNVHAVDARGLAALYWAAERGHERVVQLLLEKGTDVNLKSCYGWTALHGAAYSGHEKVAQLLLEHGAFVNATNMVGETPLHVAAGVGARNVAHTLLQRGAVIDHRRNDGITPLHNAISYGRRKLVRFILEMCGDSDYLALDLSKQIRLSDTRVDRFEECKRLADEWLQLRMRYLKNIYIRDPGQPDGCTLVLHGISERMPVKEFAQLVASHKGFDTEGQWLDYGGKRLREDSGLLLVDYGLQENANLEVKRSWVSNLIWIR